MRRFFGPAITALVCALTVAGAAAGSRERTPSLAALLARHAPVLVLHPAEEFQPVPVEGFLADSDLTRKSVSGWETVPGPLPKGGADLRLDQRDCVAIDGPAASPCYAAAEAAHAASPVVYGAAFRTKTRIDLQYWLWYPYDDYSATDPPGEVWQVHEGDWESVSVILDRDGRPLVVALSAHCEGTRRAWAGVERRGLRPLVYVALGSHANYFGTGIHPHDPVCWPPEARDIVRVFALADRTGAGRVVRPRLVRVTATSPSWMTFAGAWGETGYLHFPNNPPLAYNAGPRGPAFHAQWRRPVVEAMSWQRG
jgi:Vacuolar protein sorting-associated protein 62